MPSQTPRGYPYPLGPEQAQGSSDIQALGEAVDADVSAHESALDPHPQYANPAPSMLYASSSFSQAGTSNQTLVCWDCYVDLTPGTWMVQGGVYAYNTITRDGWWTGLTDGTTTYANSIGPSSECNVDLGGQCMSALTLITVTSGTRRVHPFCWPNGSSALTIGGGAAGPSQMVSAIRIGD